MASKSYAQQQIDFWISSEFYSVGLSAFAGVAIRVGLENFFAGKSTTDKGNFIDIFFQNTYLVPNLIGSFIMAVCIANMKQITDISTPLYKFLTTGLCGCITTYSSWMNGVLDESFDQFSFYGMPIRILLEFWLTWSIFTLGFSSVKLVGELYGMLYPPKKEVPVATPTPPPAPAPAPAPAPSPVPAPAAVTQTPSPTSSITSNPMMSGSVSLQPKKSKRTSTVKFMESEDDGRMLSHEEAEALEAEASRQNTLANAGSRGNTRASNLGIGRLSSARGIRSSNLGTDGAVTMRPSAWGRGSAAPQKYDRNSLFAVEEEVVFNEVAGRISVWREDGILESENNDGFGRPSLAVRARNAKSFGRGSVARMSTSVPKRSDSANDVEMGSESFGVLPSGKSSVANSLVSAANADFKKPDATAASTPAASPEEPDEGFFMNCLLFAIKYEYYFWSALFWGVALPMWSLLIVGRDLPYFENATGRNLFRSVALAPFGAWVRWAPTRLPWIKAYWPEMNPQTFIVNQLAVFVMACLVIFSPSYTWTDAINNGFNGSCSTVSTWMAELHSLYFEKGPYRAFRYGIWTVLVSIIIIQILRGINTPVN